jgi:hypothetical protein
MTLSKHHGWTCGKCGGPVAGKFDTCKACGHPEKPMTPSDEKTYIIETVVTVRRVYTVKAANIKEAECKSVEAQPDFEEDINEETHSIQETDPEEAR